MGLHEIALPESKSETEWVRGKPLRKKGGSFTHAALQAAFCAQLHAWARGRGAVGIAWRFRVAPAGEVFRPLVPDIAYVSEPRLAELRGYDRECPPLAPDIVIEILAPEDRRIDIDHKIDVYARAGCSLVIVVDPKRRIVELHDARDHFERSAGATIEHQALPGFMYEVDALFAEITPPGTP